MRFAALCWTSLAPVACSADAVEEPLPTLETQGAFVAMARQSEDGYRLFRTRAALAFSDGRTFLFFDEHLAGAEDLAEARSKARDLELDLVMAPPYLKSAFVMNPHHVIWYRSLTAEERGVSGL